MKRSTLPAFLVLTFFLSGVQGFSTEATRLKAVMDAAVEAVYSECCDQHTNQDKETRVRSVLESEYDLSVIIRRAIGRNWGLMSEPEQEQVLELVKQLIVRTFIKYLEGKGRPEVELGKVLTISDKRMEIPSTVQVDDLKINMVYRLGRMSSGWQIYDIVAEDISVVSNFREQLDDHFRQGNGQELIDKLNELLTKEGLDDDLLL